MNGTNDFKFGLFENDNSNKLFSEQTDSTNATITSQELKPIETQREFAEINVDATQESLIDDIDETPKERDISESPPESEMSSLSFLFETLRRIEQAQQKNSAVLREMDRKYHNGFDSVITRQQAELDVFREGLGRNALVVLLKEIASLYSDYVALLLRNDDLEKIKNGFSALLEDVLQLLHENGVEEYNSPQGGKYSLKFCKPFEKIKTADPELNGTVIESRNTGFYIDKTLLTPERVKIYVYDESYAESIKNTLTEET